MSTNTEKLKKELSKWEKVSKLKPYVGYTVVIVLLLSLVMMLDEFATSSVTSLQTSIVTEFFVNKMGLSFAEGLSQYSLIGTAMMLFSILATVFMSLADRFGRKLILNISVAGMALGAFMCALSTNLTMLIIGRIVLSFFISTDIHRIYIMEVAPAKKRGLLTSMTSFFGYLGIMLISVARDIFTTNGELAWRGVFFLPTVVGVVLMVALLMFGREPEVFAKQRVGFLKKTFRRNFKGKY